MSIEYYRKSVFGNTLYYLADNRQAMQLNSVMGRKTVTLSELNVLRDLFKVEFTEVIEPENK